MPDVAESTDHPPHQRQVDAVLFDFHGTLAQVEDPVVWVMAAAAACGTKLDRGKATVLADRLVTAGRAGGPLPYRVPPQLAEHWADRDLYEHSHRAAYTGLAATVQTDVEGLADALYERLLGPDGWLPYADTEPTLRTLHEAGVKVGVVSNVGFDIRPHFAAWGLTGLVDAFVLSYEVGRCKPDPAIFLRACGLLAAEPERTLMVGDTPADAGAVKAGCAALVLPAAEPGRSNGLGATLALAGCAV
ncbi:MAG TPA: HAD-IA family hydrolase [Actinoplanes sp.]|nr:HAD-IA family hydrolase [Actinoplanes sp.]